MTSDRSIGTDSRTGRVRTRGHGGSDDGHDPTPEGPGVLSDTRVSVQFTPYSTSIRRRVTTPPRGVVRTRERTDQRLYI